MSIDRIKLEVRKDLEAAEDRMAALVGQRSISEGNLGVDRCAAVLMEMHRDLGFDEVEVFQGDGLPNVWAYADAGTEETLAVYLMFDHAPPGKGWKRDPYGTEIDSVGPYPRAMFGQGIATKGPYIALLSAIGTLKRVGILPFNVACLMEGEEFVGSTHYRDMIEHYADRLDPCIGAIMPSAGQHGDGSVDISLGSKGCAYFELVSRGKEGGRGPIASGVHSSAQGVVHSPVWRLVEALDSLVVPGSWGLEVAFEGFYDGAALPVGSERDMALEVFDHFREDDLKLVLPGIAGRGAVAALLPDVTNEEVFLRLLYYPTFNINGLRAGYTGPHSPLFTLPGEARARLDMRFGKGQSGASLMRSLRDHLDQNGFEDIEIVNMGTHDAASATAEDSIVAEARRTYDDLEIPVRAVWPIKPSGAPLGDFNTVLDAPALSGVGIGRVGSEDGQQYMVLEGDDSVAGLAESIEFFCRYLVNLGKD